MNMRSQHVFSSKAELRAQQAQGAPVGAAASSKVGGKKAAKKVAKKVGGAKKK
jgi:hypothetical protein